jgi:predicted transcriptional regulator
MFKPLTKAEEQIMQALWKIEKGFTKDIITELPDPKPHYNTVSTILKILLEKGFVNVESIGKSHLYRPAIHKNLYRKKFMNQLVKGYFEGSFTNMVSFFARQKDISVQDLEQILKEMKKNGK